jgi:PAS domain S-box-containing protein
MGLSVVVGWFLHLTYLIQIHENFRPVQFNSALLFCVTSFALIAYQKNKFLAARYASLFIITLAGITYLEYLLGIDLKIDELFLKSYISAIPAHPGRMASNTSVCFILSGIAIFFMSKAYSFRSELVSTVSGVSVFSFAALSLFAATKTTLQYGWGNFSSMALMTAIGFIALGIVITFESLRLIFKKGANLNVILPMMVSIGALTAVIALWQVSLQYQTSEIHKTTETKAEAIRDQITQGLESNLRSVERMAARFETTPKLPEHAWREDAKLYLKHLGVLEVLSVIDENKFLRWVEPDNLKMHKFNFGADEFRNHYLEEAKRTQKTVLTPVTELKRGGRGFILFVPIQSKENPLGYLAGAIYPAKFIQHVLNLNDYELSLSSNTETIYSNLSQSPEYVSQWSVKLPIVLQDQVLTLVVNPTLQTIRLMESSFPYVILLGGVFISLLLGLMLHFALALRKQSEALHEQRNFLDLVIDSSPLGIVVIGRDHKIKKWNLACEQTFGWSSDEVMNKELPFVTRENQNASNDFIDQVISSRNRNEMNVQRTRRDGTPVDIRVYAMPLQEGEEVSGLIAIIEDVTKEKLAEQEIAHARRIAEKAAAAKSEFLVNMSHEIRTPLNGIIGMSDLLLDTSLEGEQKRYANIIQNSATTLLSLLNDMLDLSKLEAGKMQLEQLDFSLIPFVESQVEILISKAREKNLSLVTFISPDLPQTVRGDPGRISQVLLNLIGNAIKFSHEGGVSLRVDAAGERVRFEVQDTGIGLSTEAIKKLFKPFTQGDGSTARKYGGTGLGLSICKSLVESLGGDIGILSSEGNGSTFWFEIPLAEVGSKTNAKIGDSEKRILVVDQDRINLEIIKKYLIAWKIEGDCISDVKHSFELIQKSHQEGRPYDLLLLSSAHLGEEIKKYTHDKTPKMVLMLDFEKTLNEGKKDLFAEVINKPIKQSQLYDSIVRQGAKPEAKISYLHPSEKVVLRSERILVADDVGANQLLALKYLEKLGFSAQAVGNGKEVIEALERSHFDLILMDCQMPEMDGFEATRVIREMKNSKFNLITIVALTANAIPGDEKLCLEAGMNDYLSKPFKKERLGQILERWLGPGLEQKNKSG